MTRNVDGTIFFATDQPNLGPLRIDDVAELGRGVARKVIEFRPAVLKVPRQLLGSSSRPLPSRREAGQADSPA